jgi:phosphonate transport system substrate-binding protein
MLLFIPSRCTTLTVLVFLLDPLLKSEFLFFRKKPVENAVGNKMGFDITNVRPGELKDPAFREDCTVCEDDPGHLERHGIKHLLQAFAAFRGGFLITAALLLFAFAFGCDGDTQVADFSKTVVIKQPEFRAAGEHSLRVAVAAMISPKETFVYHRQVLDYIGRRLDLDVVLVQRKTYGEINELFGKNRLDLAFICSGPYATGKEKYGFELMATPEVRGSHFYYAYLIVHKDSPFQRLEDLKGQVFAFTDPDSNTGRLVPVYWLAQMHERPESFFGETIRTYGHDNSILAVAWGLADGAAVDSLVWEYYNTHNLPITARTRIIKKSAPYGIPPLVAHKNLPLELKTRIRRLLYSMHQDPEGKKILDGLMIDRFVVPREEWYEPIRRMKKELPLLVR